MAAMLSCSTRGKPGSPNGCTRLRWKFSRNFGRHDPSGKTCSRTDRSRTPTWRGLSGKYPCAVHRAPQRSVVHQDREFRGLESNGSVLHQWPVAATDSGAAQGTASSPRSARRQATPFRIVNRTHLFGSGTMPVGYPRESVHLPVRCRLAVGFRRARAPVPRLQRTRRSSYHGPLAGHSENQRPGGTGVHLVWRCLDFRRPFTQGNHC